MDLDPHKEFLENIEERITSLYEVAASTLPDSFNVTIRIGHVICGIQIELIEFADGQTFVEIDLWLLENVDEPVTVEMDESKLFDDLIKFMNPELRWGKLVPEGENISLTRNELISELLDQADEERVFKIVEEMVTEYVCVHRVVMTLLAEEEITQDQVIHLLREPGPEHVEYLH